MQTEQSNTLRLLQWMMAASLALPDQNVDPGSLIQAFLNRKDGSDKLADALAKHRLTAATTSMFPAVWIGSDGL